MSMYIWLSYSDLTQPGPPNGGLVREIPLFQGNIAILPGLFCEFSY